MLFIKALIAYMVEQQSEELWELIQTQLWAQKCFAVLIVKCFILLLQPELLLRSGLQCFRNG